jgi:hypothetical protein
MPHPPADAGPALPAEVDDDNASATPPAQPEEPSPATNEPAIQPVTGTQAGASSSSQNQRNPSTSTKRHAWTAAQKKQVCEYAKNHPRIMGYLRVPGNNMQQQEQQEGGQQGHMQETEDEMDLC